MSQELLVIRQIALYSFLRQLSFTLGFYMKFRMFNLIKISFFIILLIVTGCAHVREPRINHITGQSDDLRPRVEAKAVRLVLFPINVAPNTISNFIIGLRPGNLWPIQYLLLPISAPIWGIQDAFLGYPFWSPSAKYE
jgi:hypothetical protein